jgi:hypothetical protein
VARRFTGLLAVSMFSAAMLLVTACSSSSSGTPSNASTTSSTPSATDSLTAMQNRERQLTPLFVQCLAQHNIPIWDKSQGNQNVAALGTKGGWYKNGQVTANTAFDLFFQDIEGTYPISPDFKPEQMVAQWIDGAASTGTWPSVCGPLPSAS